MCSVNSRSWPWQYRYVLTPDAMIQEWTKFLDTAKGSHRYPLVGLSPRLCHQMVFGDGSQPLFRKAVVFLAGAACMYFSTFNNQIPLLAPLLAVIGGWALIAGACRLRQFDWTIITRTNGDRAVAIRHSRANRSEIEVFEKLFVKAVNDQGQNKDSANQASHETSKPALGAASSAHGG
jgi:hypothetical protein